MQSTRYSCQSLTKLEISRHISQKYSPPDFTEIRPTGAELFHAGGGTDRHHEAKSRFWQFCESA